MAPFAGSTLKKKKILGKTSLWLSLPQRADDQQPHRYIKVSTGKEKYPKGEKPCTKKRKEFPEGGSGNHTFTTLMFF